ncbi:MAG: NAD(P)-dependent oxidoreductase, partial [Actinomycetota bacterium]
MGTASAGAGDDGLDDPVEPASLGFVGLGDMGGAMATHLLDAGFPLIVHDLADASVAPVVEAGAGRAASAAAVAEASDHIGVCVPADGHVIEVVAGPDGILDGARPGTSVAVHSTVRPETVVSLAEQASERDVVVFDAGVAGGADKARAGQLAITVGVPEGGLPDAARAALDASGGIVVECGPVGTGLATKIANNVMTYLQFAGISAAFEVVRAGGGEPDAVLEVLRHNDMLGALTEQFSAVPLMDVADKTSEGFAPYLWATIGLAEKDLDLAVALSPDDAGPRPVLEAVRDGMWRVYGM